MVTFQIPDRVIDVYVLFLQTFDAVSRYTETELLKAGISYTQYSVLVLLDNTPVPLTLTELSRWMFRSKNSMTTVIDHMERDGLVQRVRDTKDRRAIRVVATEAGRDLFDRVRQPSRDLVYRIMSCFDHEDLSQFSELLQRIRRHTLQELARGNSHDLPAGPNTFEAGSHAASHNRGRR